MNTKVVGNKTEARVMSALLEVYPVVLLPFGDNERYDFVFEDFDKSFKRVQCKTGRYKEGVVEFNAYSTTRVDGKHTTTSYSGEDIDFFGVSCPDFSDVWLVPMGDITSATKVRLRIDPYAKQQFKCKWAKDYLLYSPC